MAYSKIVLTFTGDVSGNIDIDDYVNFRFSDLDIPINRDTTEVCKTIRDGANKFLWDDGYPNRVTVAQNYATAFGLDYGKYGLTVSILSNIVTIEATKNNIEFSLFSTNSDVSAVITNEVTIPLFEINSIDFSANVGSECNSVSVDITTNITVTDVTSPVIISGNPDNTVSFNHVRGATFTLEINNGVTYISQSVTTPDFLAEPTYNLVNTPSGATISIYGDLSFTLQYSLNNVDWQNSSVFSGLSSGNYTAYIKDQYGCVKSVAFTVDEFTEQIAVTTPVAYISNTNALRFKENKTWDNISIYKTKQNTLSCEENVKIPRLYVQKFQSNDIITTQIKTNYETIVVKAHDTNGGITTLTSTKKTENIGLKDKRDGLGYEFSDGRYGFYFMSGDTYDYDTGVVTGTYELFGAIPDWAKVGQYILIDDTTYYKVIDIVYEESVNARVLVIDVDLSGNPSAVTVATIYNAFEWDAYEFNTDMSGYANKTFYIEITLTDSTFDTLYFKSEPISVTTLLENLLEIKYKNSNNNDIVWSTGIEFLLRLSYDTFDLASESEIDIHKTDNYVYKLGGNTYPKEQLILTYLSTMMARKIMQLFVLDTISINGISYTTESIDEPKRIGQTNLYNITIKLYEAKGELETQPTTDVSNIELDTLEVPDLVDSGDGLIEQ